ncbi:MAG: S8 family serine peptidase [Coriobacteriales bacterium]|nr:S8 family serine peptidase [Coriobacteriales bacterium]
MLHRLIAISLAVLLCVPAQAAFAQEPVHSDTENPNEVILREDGTVRWPLNLRLPEPGEEYALDEILVCFKLGTTVAAAYAALDDLASIDGLLQPAEITEYHLARQYPLTLSLTDGYTVTEALQEVFDHPDIDWAEVNGVNYYADELSQAEYVPYDEHSNKEETPWVEQINILLAWQHHASFQQAYVAVLDGGVVANHEDLQANLAMEYSRDLAGNNNSLLGQTLRPVHGTHVAGIISAVVNNGIGIAGVSHNAKVIPINVFDPETDQAYDEDIAEAINYVVDSNIANLHVINMSLGRYGKPNALVRSAIQRAQAKDIVVVCAAGNDTSSETYYPSDYDECISVIALNVKANAKAWFSNFGEAKDISAPGQNILSTTTAGKYGQISGTSMAAPMVAGAAALLFSYNPGLTADKVKDLLYRSATDLYTENYDPYSGHGCLDVGMALSMLMTPNFIRLGGPHRYSTMELISNRRANTAHTAIVASADSYPDALSASALAGIYDAPVLLTSTDPSASLAPETRQELIRLGATNVIIVGLEAAVSPRAEADIANIAGVTNVFRYGGIDRYATACEIYSSNRAHYSNTAVIASGEDFPDALSIGPYAYVSKSPIFMAGADCLLSQQTIDTIRGGSFTNIVFVGGTARISEDVKTQLGGGYAYERLAGADRYETSNIIAAWSRARGLTLSHVALTTGEQFPDALCGAALCGKNRSVILLASDTPGGYAAIDGNLTGAGSFVELGYILGGTAAVSDSTAAYAESKLNEGH